MNNTTLTPASNSEVLKRFGRRMIMCRAHGIWARKQFEYQIETFADALRSAWKSFRSQINRERESAAKRDKIAAQFQKYGLSKDSALRKRHRPGVHGYGRGTDRWLTTVIGA